MLRCIDSCPNSLKNWSGFVDVALRMVFPLLVACGMITMGAYVVCMYVCQCCYVCCNHSNCMGAKPSQGRKDPLYFQTKDTKCRTSSPDLFYHQTTWFRVLSHFYFSRLCLCVGCWCQSCNLTKAYFKSKNFFSVLHWDAVDIPGQTVLYSVQYNQ